MNASLSTGNVNKTAEVVYSEAQNKYIQDRLTRIEQCFGDLCTEFIGYTRRTAKLRNNGDEVVRILLNYAESEKANRSTSEALRHFAESVASAEDYRHAEVDRLVAKVVNPLAQYGEELKGVKANLKQGSSARKKEMAQMKKLDKTSHADRTKHTKALQGLQQATSDATRSSEIVERHVLEFEKKKLQGIKKIMTDFVQIEMMWHAKALETLSQAFSSLQIMHEEQDLEEFRSTLHHMPATPTRLDRHRSASLGSLPTSANTGFVAGAVSSPTAHANTMGDGINASHTLGLSASGSRPPPGRPPAPTPAVGAGSVGAVRKFGAGTGALTAGVSINASGAAGVSQQQTGAKANVTVKIQDMDQEEDDDDQVTDDYDSSDYDSEEDEESDDVGPTTTSATTPRPKARAAVTSSATGPGVAAAVTVKR